MPAMPVTADVSTPSDKSAPAPIGTSSNRSEDQPTAVPAVPTVSSSGDQPAAVPVGTAANTGSTQPDVPVVDGSDFGSLQRDILHGFRV